MPPNRDPGVMHRCTDIVLHHTVTGQPATIDAATATVQQIDREHLAKTEPDGRPTYSDIAYNLLVGPDVVYIGRGPTINDGATDNDVTTDTVSISVLGDYRIDIVTPPYRAAIDAAVRLCRDVWGPLPVRPHHDFYNTACPGPHLDAIIDSLNEAPDMTEDEFFTHPLTLSDGEPPVPYPTNVEGWFIYVHREFQIMRQLLEELLAKP